MIKENGKIAFIKSQWHNQIVDKAETGFIAEFESLGFSREDIAIFSVPGAFDIPLYAKKMALSGRFKAIVAAGFVVDGGIYRHEFVASAVIDGLMQVQLETEIPVISSVLTPHQFQETQAHEQFFQQHFIEKGAEAARAVAHILQNFDELPKIIAHFSREN